MRNYIIILFLVFGEVSAYSQYKAASLPGPGPISNLAPALFIPISTIAVFPKHKSATAPATLYKWKHVAGATGYRLFIGTDFPPSNLVNNVQLTDTVYTYSTPSSTLFKTVYWQVIPFNTAGQAINCPVWNYFANEDNSVSPLFPALPWWEDFTTYTNFLPPPNYAQENDPLWVPYDPFRVVPSIPCLSSENPNPWGPNKKCLQFEPASCLVFGYGCQPDELHTLYMQNTVSSANNSFWFVRHTPVKYRTRFVHTLLESCQTFPALLDSNCIPFRLTFEMENTTIDTMVVNCNVINYWSAYSQGDFVNHIVKGVFHPTNSGNLGNWYDLILDLSNTPTGFGSMYFEDMEMYAPRPGLWDADQISLSTSWTNPKNWDDEQLPTSNSDILIPGGCFAYPELTSPVTVHNFIMDPGAGLLGNNYLTVTNSKKIRLYLTPNTWHFVSSPVSQAKVSAFQGMQVKIFDEVNYQWVTITDTSYALLTRGYAVKDSVAHLIEFTGSMRTGNVNLGVTYTSPAHEHNLVGNPYVSSIDWNTPNGSGWTRTHINNKIWIWNNGNYGVYIQNDVLGTNGVDNIIPPMQAFFIETNNTSPVLTVKEGARVSKGHPFYKLPLSIVNTIKLSVEGNGFMDQLIVRFDSLATSGYDEDYDADKMFGTLTAPQFYTIIDDTTYLSINTFGPLVPPKEVQLYFEPGLPGTFTITPSEVESFDTLISVQLIDLKQNVVVNMKDCQSYTFQSDTTEDYARFKLVFGASGIGIPKIKDQETRIYSDGVSIFLCPSKKGYFGKSHIEIYDLLGRKVYETQINVIDKTSLKPNLPPSLYVVRLIEGKHSLSQKVILQQIHE